MSKSKQSMCHIWAKKLQISIWRYFVQMMVRSFPAPSKKRGAVFPKTGISNLKAPLADKRIQKIRAMTQQQCMLKIPAGFYGSHALLAFWKCEDTKNIG